jgi:hypothetical protein
MIKEIKGSNYKRYLLFLIGCMGTRYGLAYLSYNKGNTEIGNTKMNINKYISIFTLLAGLGFLIIYFGGYRKTGLETGGEKIWWNNLRPLHAILYLLFTYMVWFSNDIYKPWKILTLDATIGLVSFLYYHISNYK